METDYRGYTIVYDEGAKEFRTESDEHGTLKHADLAGLKRIIDRKEDEPEEKAKKQPKQDALEVNTDLYGSVGGLLKDYKAVKLGAFGMLASRYRNASLAVWKYTGYKYKTRERINLDSNSRLRFIKDTPENRVALDTILKRAENLRTYVADEKEAMNADIEALEKVQPTLSRDELPQWER